MLAEARWHLLGLQATWPLLAELGWLSPALLEEVAQRSPDPLLSQLVRGVEANFDATSAGAGEMSEMSCFAAWVLAERPGLREQFALAQRPRSTVRRRPCGFWWNCWAWSGTAATLTSLLDVGCCATFSPRLYAACMKRR